MKHNDRITDEDEDEVKGYILTGYNAPKGMW